MCSIVFAQENNQTQQQKEKQDCRSVIVDAWLVKVGAEALYDSGVQPLSEKENGTVTIKNLMWCMSEPNALQVIASASTNASLKNQAESKLEKVEYLKQEQMDNLPVSMQPVKSITYTPYSSATQFKTFSRIADDKKIKVEYSFQANNFIVSESNAPAEEIKIAFSNIIFLPQQRQIIAAQSQTGNDLFFLVMRAEIVE